MNYAPRIFTLPELTGISKKQIDVHLALYQGYVKHTNLIMDRIQKLRDERTPENAETTDFLINELRRRQSFEFDGMRMHEYYFEQFEGGPKEAMTEGPLLDAVHSKYQTWDAFIARLKEVCGTRGIGWTVVYVDPVGRTVQAAWVDDHQIGQLAGLPILMAIDMWEHAYMVDYVPAEKKSYVEAFLQNVNWSVVEGRFLASVT